MGTAMAAATNLQHMGAIHIQMADAMRICIRGRVTSHLDTSIALCIQQVCFPKQNLKTKPRTG